MMAARKANFSSLTGQAMLSTTRLHCESIILGTAWTGSALFYRHEVDGVIYPYLVTNKHVVRGVTKVNFNTLRQKPDGTPDLGNTVFVELLDMPDGWYGHPSEDVDIAVCSIGELINESQSRNDPLHMVFITSDYVPTDSDIADLSAVEQVTMIGYPNGLADEVNGLPIIRSGITASHPAVDFDGQPVFLIDASVFPGSSGSPVFIISEGAYKNKSSVLMFLGVLSAGHFMEEEGKITHRPSPVAEGDVPVVEQMIDIGVVHRSYLVAETIDAALSGTAPPVM